MSDKYSIVETELYAETACKAYPTMSFAVIVCTDEKGKDIKSSPLIQSLYMQSYQNFDIIYSNSISKGLKKITRLDCDYFLLMKPEDRLLFNALNSFALCAQKSHADILYTDECIFDMSKGYREKGVEILRPEFIKRQLINENILGECVAINKSFFAENYSKEKENINKATSPRDVFSCMLAYAGNVKHIDKILINKSTNSELWDYKSNKALKAKGKNLLVVCHELSRTGAPIVLMYTLKLLVKNGFNVSVIAYRSGELWKEFSKAGVNLLLVDDDKLTAPLLSKTARDFDLVLINTIEPYYAFDALNNTDIPTLVWVHESKDFFNFIKPKLPKRLSDNFSLYNISKLSLNEMHKVLPQYKSYGLLRSVYEDFSKKYKEEKTESLSFICIGTIYKTKGQDILAEAIKLLPEEKIKKCTFTFVGENRDDEIFGTISTLCEELPGNVEYKKALPQDKLFSLLSTKHCLICPSRTESLSSTVIEAMILSIPSIVSEFAGISEFVTDTESGLVYKDNSKLALKECIEKLIDEPDKIKTMGKKAREAYENNFSPSAFEENALPIIDSLIK